MADLLTPTSSAPTGAGSSGSFPQGSTATGNSPLDAYLGSAQQILARLTPGTFSSDYGVSSSQMPTFLDANGKLNSSAAEWVAYHLMSQSDRQALQDVMVTAGVLKTSDVNGVLGTASNDAFRSLVGTAASQGVSADALIGQVNQGGLGAIQSEIQGETTTAQSEVNKQTPVSATLENPTTLAAILTAGFDQTQGYAPDAAQIQAFVSGIQSQDVSYAQSGNEANKAQAQADLSRAQSAESALNKLGPDGIDSFLSAYANAIHGTGAPGAGTVQGPSLGTAGASPQATGLPTTAGAMGPIGFRSVPGAPAPQRDFMGDQLGTTPTTKEVQTQGPQAPGVLAPTAALTPSQLVAAGGVQHGGLYALSPALWQQAIAQYPAAKAYASAGSAPQAVQQAAVTALSQHLYGQSGSWSDVAITLAGGSPQNAGSEKVLGKTNLQTFAEGVANDVNDSISQLQSQVNAPGPAVTTKVTAPDATAEANLAAKSADPVGYYAANYASAGSLLNQMLAGAPQMYGQGTADTFTGPVPVGAASAPAATTA